MIGLIGLLLCPALVPSAVLAVSVQRLTVPDLVVVDQLNQQQPPPQPARSSAGDPSSQRTQTQTQTQTHSVIPQPPIGHNLGQQPEAASLMINPQDLTSGAGSHTTSEHQQQQQQLTFECLISYDRKKDKNLIIKWHHDDRLEPIYQWIVELDKISIAPQYRPYILANNSTMRPPLSSLLEQQQLSRNATSNQQQVQLLEASFRLIRPSKELGGKYTCSAISIQNDDSKWRKMIVFTPPRSFKFNATRTDFGQQSVLAVTADRMSLRARQTTNLPAPLKLTSATDPDQHQSAAAPPPNELPPAYRSRGFDGQPASTISPQMYKTIDYVNVNPNYRSASPSSRLPPDFPAVATAANPRQPARRLMTAAAANGAAAAGSSSSSGSRYSGVKLICDIDQIFPVPEVSIYRLAIGQSSSNGTSHVPPMDKLTKSETRIEKNPITGLYHIQVISVLLDDEIDSKYGSNELVYFECLIGLTNLELSKYSDNKRSLVYRRSSPASSLSSQQQGMQSEQMNNNNNLDDNSERSSSSSRIQSGLAVNVLLMMNSLLVYYVFMRQLAA